MLTLPILAFLLTSVVNADQDKRCLDPAVSEVMTNNEKCRRQGGGYSWHSASQDCVFESRAACAQTRNKFRHKNVCLEMCRPLKKRPNYDNCHKIPAVFQWKLERLKGNASEKVRPRPCPDAELRSISLYYYDGNVMKCHKSHLQICPGDENTLFNSDNNAFASLVDCMNQCAPEDIKCDLPFGLAKGEYLKLNDSGVLRYSFHNERRRCEPFLYFGLHQENPKIWANRFETLEQCQKLCLEPESPSGKSIDPDMPSPRDPEPWQCTDVAAIQAFTKSRSCLAFDNSNGYTFFNGECIPSDYNGCIDTYNKFKDLETCTKVCLDIGLSCGGGNNLEMEKSRPCKSSKKLAHPLRAFTYDAGQNKCVELENFDGCSQQTHNVFLDLEACRRGEN